MTEKRMNNSSLEQQELKLKIGKFRYGAKIKGHKKEKRKCK